MFTRFRSGRRASPPRLSVERLEDRLVPHGGTFGVAPSALALVGPVAVAPRSDGPSQDQTGPHLDLLSAGKQAQTAEDRGPAAAYGRGNGAESRGAVPGWQSEPRSELGPDAHGTPAGEHEEGRKSSDGGSIPGWGNAHGWKDYRSEDQSASEVSSHHASSAENSSGSVVGRSASPPAAGAARSAEPTEARDTTSSTTHEEEGPHGGWTGEPTPPRVSASGVFGPPAPAAASDGNSETSARASAAPVPVLNLLAATQDGSEGAAEAAPAGSPAAGNSAALAVLDSHAAGPAALHGTAGLGDDFLNVVLARDVPRVSDGTLAEAADLGDPAAPSASPAAAYDGYATLEAPAGGLLDRLGLDTRALDAALQDFLHGLDRLGGRLADPRSRLGASAWLLTGAAALAVVELDRRRRAAAAEGAGEGPLTWPGPGAPAPEPTS